MFGSFCWSKFKNYVVLLSNIVIISLKMIMSWFLIIAQPWKQYISLLPNFETNLLSWSEVLKQKPTWMLNWSSIWFSSFFFWQTTFPMYVEKSLWHAYVTHEKVIHDEIFLNQKYGKMVWPVILLSHRCLWEITSKKSTLQIMYNALV